MKCDDSINAHTACMKAGCSHGCVCFVKMKTFNTHAHTHTKHRFFDIGTTVINVSAVSIFGVIQGNVVYSYEAPDI